MRILLVAGSYPPMKCGVGDYTAALADGLVSLGHQVAVITSTAASERPSQESARVFATISSWQRSEFAEFKRVVGEWKPDIIHLQLPTLGYGAGDLPWRLSYLAHALPVPLVQTWHELPAARIDRRKAEWAMALSRGDVIVVRPAFREQLPRWFRWASAHKKYEYVPNASTIPRVQLSDAQRRDLRARFGAENRRLVAFFGFLYEHKGIDDLLQLLTAQRDRLVLIGEVKQWDPYQVELVKRMAQPPYSEFVHLTGYLPGEDAGAILAAADAIAMPYRQGGGSWNTSLHAAVMQGSFVLTTSYEQHGYDAALNVYFARPGDVEDLRAGLDAHAGKRNTHPDAARQPPTWQEVAERHVEFYRRHLRR